MGTYILKRKIFRRDNPEKWNVSEYGDINRSYVIEYSSRYNKQLKESPGVGLYVKGLIKDLRNGFIYEDGKYGGDTHYLKDFSKPGKFLTYSKGITTFDRLNYRIYRPTVSDNGLYLVFTIVIDNISGHKVSGKEYSIKTV